MRERERELKSRLQQCPAMPLKARALVWGRPRWLSLSGPDRFSRCVASLRAAVKDVLVPAMCELVGVQPRRPGDAAGEGVRIGGVGWRY